MFHAEQEKFLTCDPQGEGEEYKKAKDFDKKKFVFEIFRFQQRQHPVGKLRCFVVVVVVCCCLFVVCLFIHMFVCLLACLFVYLFVCLFV